MGFVSEKKPDILLGYFNINAFCTNSHTTFKHVLSDCKLLVFEPTHLDRELLDHLFISNSFCANKSTTVVIKNAAKLQISLKSNNDIEESIDFSIV